MVDANSEKAGKGSQIGRPRDTAQAVIEGATGLVSLVFPGHKEQVDYVGHALQRMRCKGFWEILFQEVEELRNRGRIADDYWSTDQGKDCLQEIVDCIEKDSPDQVRFDAVKKLFLVAATEEHSDRDSPLPLEFMRTCRSLSSAEILILSTAYRCGKKLGMGKSCVRFKNLANLPVDLIGEAITRIPVEEFIRMYEMSRKKT